MRRLLFLTAALTLGSRPSFADWTTPVTVSTSAFQTVCADLRAVTQVQTDFVEEKTLHILSHPLISKGTLLFSSGQGVYRVTQEPIRQEMLITREHLVQKDAQGNIQRMKVRGQPAAQAFVDIFLSFFAGDSRAWEKVFEASFSGSESAWTIEFTPHRKSPAARALRRIILEGDHGLLHAMTLTEANGDVTHTAYSHPREASSSFPLDLKAP